MPTVVSKRRTRSARGKSKVIVVMRDTSPQRFWSTLKQPHLVHQSMEQSSLSILSISLISMRKEINISTTKIKPEIRTWYAFEGPLGEVVHNKRFFFAWKEGCLMGTYNTLEEATESLAPGERRKTN